MYQSFKHTHRKHNHTIAPLLTLAIAGQLGASETATEYLDANAFDKTWALATLYKDDLNPFLQEFKLRGRYHGQYHDVNADNGDSSGWEDRRSRFGFDAKLFDKQLEMRLDFQSNDGFEDFYDGLVDAYLKWKPNEKIAVTLGKTKPLVAYADWISSTNETPAFERSQIFNQLGINRATALTVEGDYGGLLWQAGIYSNDTPTSTGGSGAWGDGEFGELDGGHSFSLGAGYNFNHQLDVEKALLRLDWLHSERDAADVVLNRYDDIISTTFQLKEGYWNLTAEAFAASGGDGVNGDVFGFYLQPTYDIIPDKLQLVGRYSYANGDGPASVQAQSRYEREVPIKPIPGVAGSRNRGDEYQAVYLGAQYFIYGNKLKLMAGAEWAQLTRDGRPTGYDGITTLAGIRFSF
jgi:phosphate-selective porin OprO/OprP